MTQLTVNGDPVETSAATLRELVEQTADVSLDERGAARDGTRLGIAVAVDGAVVPRSRWASASLAAGAEVEIVTAKQGG